MQLASTHGKTTGRQTLDRRTDGLTKAAGPTTPAEGGWGGPSSRASRNAGTCSPPTPPLHCTAPQARKRAQAAQRLQLSIPTPLRVLLMAQEEDCRAVAEHPGVRPAAPCKVTSLLATQGPPWPHSTA